MGQKTRSFLKNENSDFDNILDSMLNLADADAQTVTSAVTVTGATTLSNTLTYNSGLTGIVMPNVTAVTALAAAGALAKNTTYHVTDTDGAAYTLPAAADSTAGDIICVKYIAILADGEVHKFGTAGEFFSAASCVFSSTNSANGVVFTADVPNGSSNDFLNFTGDTNASGGIGTEFVFVYDGAKWRVTGHAYGTGTGADAAVGVAFADS